jgi:hypothetical protein
MIAGGALLLCCMLALTPEADAVAVGTESLTTKAGDGTVPSRQDSFIKLPADSAEEMLHEAEDTANLVLSVERVTVHTGRIHDTLDVTLESGGHLVAGFDIRLALESPHLEIMEILPGEILDSCSWEFFRAKPDDDHEGGSYPRSVWHVVALAELVVDETEPHCYGLDRRASLLRLVVSSEHVDIVPDTEAAVFFFWKGCSDNSISGVTGNRLFLSSRVYDYLTVGDYESDAMFPTRLGAPKQCVDQSVKYPPRRRIEFHNGGVEFEIKLEADSTTVDSL